MKEEIQMQKKLLEYDISEAVETYAFIKSAQKGIATNGKPFLSIVFQDKSGAIEGKLWDVSDEDLKKYLPESIVSVIGEIQNYRGQKQLKIKGLRLTTALDNVSADEFLKTAPIKRDDIQQEIMQYIFAITNPNLQRVTRFLVKKYEKEYFSYPAAMRHHHEFVSGLSYHVLSMLHIADHLQGQYPDLDADLLYSGIILHDLGKVIELSGPISTSYTVTGNLLGHISIVSNEIAKAVDELQIDSEETMVLQHIILSHHGKGEWGSPKPPLVMEAELIHMIDQMDASLNMLSKALEHTDAGSYSERIFGLDNRSFYKPKFNQIEE